MKSHSYFTKNIWEINATPQVFEQTLNILRTYVHTCVGVADTRINPIYFIISPDQTFSGSASKLT